MAVTTDDQHAVSDCHTVATSNRFPGLDKQVFPISSQPGCFPFPSLGHTGLLGS